MDFRKYDFTKLHTKLYIDGRFVDSKFGKFYDVYSPYLEKVVTKVVDGDIFDVDLAVDAALRALRYDNEWRTMDKIDRGLNFHKLADLIHRDFDYIAWLEVMDTGRTLFDVKRDISDVIRILRYYAGYTDKIFGQTMMDSHDDFEIMRKEPIGVVGLIGDHKAPLLTFIRKIVPVLVTGSTLVYKPSYKTPLSSLYLTRLIDEVGFPTGVVNVITGRGDIVGKHIGMHNLIKHVTFTGRHTIGRLFLDYATKSNLKKVKLFMEGFSPLIVLRDADIDDAVKIAHHAAFHNDGMTRFRVGRIFVHDDIYELFLKKSIDLAKKRVLGDIFDDRTRVGHFIDEYHLQKYLDYIDLIKKDGAKIVYGGKRSDTVGYVVEPTIVTDVLDDMKFLNDVVYGPIKLITRFRVLDDVINLTHKTGYGLSTGIITKDFNNFMHLTKRFDTGYVWINTWHAFKPYLTYTGRNLSGYGDYLGSDIIDDYLVKKTIHGFLDTKRFTKFFDHFITY